MISKKISSVSSLYRSSRSGAILHPPTPSIRRGFAQAAPEQDPKPPVALFGLDGTYASALVSSLFLEYSSSKCMRVKN